MSNQSNWKRLESFAIWVSPLASLAIAILYGLAWHFEGGKVLHLCLAIAWLTIAALQLTTAFVRRATRRIERASWRAAYNRGRAGLSPQLPNAAATGPGKYEGP
jgi:hypothetical protein